MLLTINGQSRETEATTISELLQSIDVHPKTVVVELNGEIIRRANYPDQVLSDGDRVEIVQMMAGG